MLMVNQEVDYTDNQTEKLLAIAIGNYYFSSILHLLGEMSSPHRTGLCCAPAPTVAENIGVGLASHTDCLLGIGTCRHEGTEGHWRGSSVQGVH